jgi:hypothetical protein
MRYLKNDYTYPVVDRIAFASKLGATYQRRAASPKLIVKGLTLLDGALDLDGSFVPGKSTLVICSKTPNTLKLLAGIVNSRVASFYVKQKYASASYNGGVNFTPDMLNSIPIPDEIDEEAIVSAVDRIIDAQTAVLAVTAELHALIKGSSGPAKLRAKFNSWYLLDGAEFLKELASQGVKLSIKERAKWQDILDEHKAKVDRHLALAATNDKSIDDLLYDAFDLSLTERAEVNPPPAAKTE